MAINFCTVGSYTVNTFCGEIRALVLDRLIEEAHGPINPPKPPVLGGAGGASMRHDAPIINYLDLPYVTISVEFLGKEGTLTVAKDTKHYFVTVSDLQIDDYGAGAVNRPDSQTLH